MSKEHVRGWSDGRTRCGISVTSNTVFVDDEEETTCKRCFERTFIDVGYKDREKIAMKYLAMKKALQRMLRIGYQVGSDDDDLEDILTEQQQEEFHQSLVQARLALKMEIS